MGFARAAVQSVCTARTGLPRWLDTDDIAVVDGCFCGARNTNRHSRTRYTAVECGAPSHSFKTTTPIRLHLRHTYFLFCVNQHIFWWCYCQGKVVSLTGAPSRLHMSATAGAPSTVAAGPRTSAGVADREWRVVEEPSKTARNVNAKVLTAPEIFFATPRFPFEDILLERTMAMYVTATPSGATTASPLRFPFRPELALKLLGLGGAAVRGSSDDDHSSTFVAPVTSVTVQLARHLLECAELKPLLHGNCATVDYDTVRDKLAKGGEGTFHSITVCVRTAGHYPVKPMEFKLRCTTLHAVAATAASPVALTNVLKISVKDGIGDRLGAISRYEEYKRRGLSEALPIAASDGDLECIMLIAAKCVDLSRELAIHMLDRQPVEVIAKAVVDGVRKFVALLHLPSGVGSKAAGTGSDAIQSGGEKGRGDYLRGEGNTVLHLVSALCQTQALELILRIIAFPVETVVEITKHTIEPSDMRKSRLEEVDQGRTDRLLAASDQLPLTVARMPTMAPATAATPYSRTAQHIVSLASSSLAPHDAAEKAAAIAVDPLARLKAEVKIQLGRDIFKDVVFCRESTSDRSFLAVGATFAGDAFIERTIGARPSDQNIIRELYLRDFDPFDLSWHPPSNGAGENPPAPASHAAAGHDPHAASQEEASAVQGNAAGGKEHLPALATPRQRLAANDLIDCACAKDDPRLLRAVLQPVTSLSADFIQQAMAVSVQRKAVHCLKCAAELRDEIAVRRLAPPVSITEVCRLICIARASLCVKEVGPLIYLRYREIIEAHYPPQRPPGTASIADPLHADPNASVSATAELAPSTQLKLKPLSENTIAGLNQSANQLPQPMREEWDQSRRTFGSVLEV